MINVTIYLGDLDGSPINANYLTEGNPGVGGTQFCMLQLANYLRLQKGFNIQLISVRTYYMDSVKCHYVHNNSEVCNVAKQIRTDILILSQFNDKAFEKDLARQKIKIIIWSHNYVLSDFCEFIKSAEPVKANVFVSKQHYDRYIDDDVIYKSTFIHNMYFDNTIDVLRENDSRTVVYMGAIIPGKGFAELCSIWPGIIKAVPDAKLLVLGNGKLYGEKKLGKYGIAAEDYENKFVKYIIDDNGEIIPSVHFLGVIGKGKTEIFRKSCVGVVNPSGRTETFGMGIVEMAEGLLPVVTIGKNGHFDTIINGETGILANTLIGIQNAIIKLLTNPELNEKLGINAKSRIKMFNPEIIGPKWIKLLSNIYNDCYNFEYIKPNDHYLNNYKFIRIFLRFIRCNLGFRFIPSLIKIETYLYSKLKK